MTAYLEHLLDAAFPASDSTVRILTPRQPARRGCQLSVLLDRAVRPVNKWLQQHGVICDVREPDVIRISPVPFYNTFQDVHNFVELLKKALQATSTS